MFGLSKKSRNRLFEFTVPVTPGAASTLPVDPNCGRVVCYAAGIDEDKAKQVAILKFHLSRCVVNAGWQVREVDPKSWAHYAKTRWPRSAGSMPSQEQVMVVVEKGGFFFAPKETQNAAEVPSR